MTDDRERSIADFSILTQKFRFALDGNRVTAEKGTGFYTGIDLGIAKRHFELGAGAGNFVRA